jgi:hypothetical protein
VPVIEINSFGAIPPAKNVAALKTPAGEICGPVGAAGLTVNVTVIFCDAIPGLETVTTPADEPTERLVGFTETASVEGAAPDVGETVSHVVFDDAVQESVPLAAFVTDTLCAPGTAPPIV